MMLTGLVVVSAILLCVVLRRALSPRRTRFAVLISAATLLAVAGCSSNTMDTNTPDLSSDLSSAVETMMSTPSADAPSAGMSSGTEMSTDGSATGSEGSATYPPDQAQLCQARDDLQASLGELTSPALLTQGASAIGSAVDQVQNDLDAVVTAAQPELKPQLDAVQTSLEQLRSAVGDLGDGGIAQNVQAVGSAAGDVGSASTDLLSELDKICGS